MTHPRMTGGLAALLFSLLSLVPLACSHADAGPGASEPGDDDCSAAQKRASKQVLDVAQAAPSRTCSTDADCVTVAIGGSCFDNCTRAVNQSGATAVDASIASANAAECKAFVDDGCQLIHPPCAPPAPPSCRSGLCE